MKKLNLLLTESKNSTFSIIEPEDIVKNKKPVIHIDMPDSDADEWTLTLTNGIEIYKGWEREWKSDYADDYDTLEEFIEEEYTNNERYWAYFA